MLRRAAVQGFTLVEMMVAIVIMGILLALAANSYGVWIANSRIRTAAETLVEGLSAARNEAIKRNRQVAFRLVSDLSATCSVSAAGTSWVASVDDPSNKCNVAISDAVAPFIIAKKSAAEGTRAVTISAIDAAEAAASTVIFNGVGRVLLTGQTPIVQIDVDSGAVDGEQSRDLRIMLTSGGMIRMCDPKATDTRKC